MRQLVCVKPGQFAMLDVERPVLEAGRAIVRIKRIGVCGTDYHAYNGQQPFFTYPRVLGHELSGEIVELDSDEQGLNVGDKVAIIPYMYCGQCKTCEQGKTNCCPSLKVSGVHQDGGMQEYVSVPTSHLIQVNDLTYDEAALLEPLAIGAHAVRRAAMSEDDIVAVLGAGPIGLGIMLFAKQCGATVIAVDMNERRLAFCSDWLGVEHTVNASGDVAAQIEAITNGHMADVVLDATGNKRSMEQSFDYISYGGKLVYVGLTKDTLQFHNPDFHKRETTLMGSRNATRQDFEAVYDVLKRHTVDIQRYITHRATFAEASEQFVQWLQPQSQVIKALIQL